MIDSVYLSRVRHRSFQSRHLYARSCYYSKNHFHLNSAIGWRLGLQAVTVLVLLTFILGSCYRSASLYHPQRRAILHLKNQRKKVRTDPISFRYSAADFVIQTILILHGQIKEKNKHEEKPPFFDFTSLKSRTIQTIMVSTASIAAGLYTPLIYLVGSSFDCVSSIMSAKNFSISNSK